MVENTSIPSQPTNSAPMKAAGLLDGLKQKITVPAIGTEFLDVDLVEMMETTNSDELLRDLAITSPLSKPFFHFDIPFLHLFLHPICSVILYSS